MNGLRTMALCTAVLLCSCVPWTVRPIGEDKQTALDPAAYVESIWASRLVPAVLSQAVDARTWLDGSGASCRV